MPPKSGPAKFLPCITYQALFGGPPVHYHLEPDEHLEGPEHHGEWREIGECNNNNCRAIITNCHCGFIYKIDAIENWIKKEQPGLLHAGDSKLPSRTEGCNVCSNICSRCNWTPRGKVERPKLHNYQGMEKKLCPAHSKTGEPTKHAAEARDDLKKAELIFHHLWNNPDHLTYIRGHGAHIAFMSYQKQANEARTQGQPHPDISMFVKKYLDDQRNPAAPSKKHLDDQRNSAALSTSSDPQIPKQSPATPHLLHQARDHTISRTPIEDIQNISPDHGPYLAQPQEPPASAENISNDPFIGWVNDAPTTPEGQNVTFDFNQNQPAQSNNRNRATSAPAPASQVPMFFPNLPRVASDPIDQVVAHDQFGNLLSNRNQGQPSSNLLGPATPDPVTRVPTAGFNAYRELYDQQKDNEEQDVAPLDPNDWAIDWNSIDHDLEMYGHNDMRVDLEDSTDSATNIITPFSIAESDKPAKTPPTYESLLYDFEVSAGIQRLAGSFMSKYPEWQRNVYKTLHTANPDSQGQLSDHIEVSRVAEILKHLPKMPYKGFWDNIPTAYEYSMNTACIKLLANHVPLLPKKDDPYHTPLPRPGSRRHYFDTITLHFGQFSIERNGRLIDPEIVHLRWVHECMGWVVCEVLEGEGHPTRILNLLEAQVDLLLDLKDSQGSKMVHRARIDCAHQGCPLHCDYTRIFTGVIAIVVITAERACLQAFRSKAWEELDKRRKVFYKAMKVAAKLMDCNSVNLYRLLEQLNNPYLPPNVRADMIIKCKIYDGIIEKIDRLYLTFVDYGVMQKEHDDIEREFLSPGGIYFGWSARYAQRELDFAKSWTEFNEYINNPERPIVPCHELFSVPKDQMATSLSLERWAGHIGGDYLEDEPIKLQEVFENEPDTQLRGAAKRVRGD